MPIILTEAQSKWFSAMREEWLSVMKPFSGFGIGKLFPPVKELPQHLLDGCELLSSREQILHRLPIGSIGAEVGTQEGLFAQKIISIVRPSELHLFDIDDNPLKKRNPELLQLDTVYFHLGDSSSSMWKLPDEYFDWIYIDGCHAYEGVCKDIEAAKIKLKKGGLLVFNDYLMWSMAECIDYGVPHAVNELAISDSYKFIYFALHPHLHNDVALKKPQAS